MGRSLGRWAQRGYGLGLGLTLLVVAGCAGGAGPGDGAEAGDQGSTESATASSAASEETTEPTAEPTTVSEADAGASTFCEDTRAFAQYMAMALFGLALDPGPEAVEGTFTAADLATQVQDGAPEEIAADLEPATAMMISMAEALEGVDPEDPDAIAAAVADIDFWAEESEDDVSARIDGYLSEHCGFTFDSAAEEIMDGGSGGSGGETGDGQAEAAASPLDCADLDVQAVEQVAGSAVVEVTQLGMNESYTHTLGDQDYQGSSTGCVIDLELKEFGPEEIRMTMEILNASFYDDYDSMAQAEDGYTTLTVLGTDGFAYEAAGASTVLVLDIGADMTMHIKLSNDEPAPDVDTASELAALALGLLGSAS